MSVQAQRRSLSAGYPVGSKPGQAYGPGGLGFYPASHRAVPVLHQPQTLSVRGTERKSSLSKHRFRDTYFKLWTDLINELVILKADREKPTASTARRRASSEPSPHQNTSKIQATKRGAEDTKIIIKNHPKKSLQRAH